jgi:transposase-like protein
MTENRCKGSGINLQKIFGADQEGLKDFSREVLQEVLEQEMTDAIGAEKGERSPGRLGYHSGPPTTRNCASASQAEGTLLRAASDEQFGAQARQPAAAQLNGSGELKTWMPD